MYFFKYKGIWLTKWHLFRLSVFCFYTSNLVYASPIHSKHLQHLTSRLLRKNVLRREATITETKPLGFLQNVSHSSSAIISTARKNNGLKEIKSTFRKHRHHRKSRHPLLFDWTTSSCGECNPEMCETPPANCNTGLIRDACDCCYTCGNLEDTPCDLPNEVFRFGQCGKDLICSPSDQTNGEATSFCTCASTIIICGSDGRTYSNPCRFKRASGRKASLTRSHDGPCLAEPLMEIPPMNQTAERGSSAVFSCSVSGYPFAWFEWLKDEQNVFQPGINDGIIVQIRGGPLKYQVTTWLEIEAVDEIHSGYYTCIAKNQYGETNATARLEVIQGDYEMGNYYTYRGKQYIINDQSTASLDEQKEKEDHYAMTYLLPHMLPDADAISPEELTQARSNSEDAEHHNSPTLSSQTGYFKDAEAAEKDTTIPVDHLLEQTLQKLMKPKQFKDIFFDDDDFSEGSGNFH